MDNDTLGLSGLPDTPIDQSRHLRAILFTVRKAHAELVGREVARVRAEQVLTREHARSYIEELMPLILQARNDRRASRKLSRKV